MSLDSCVPCDCDFPIAPVGEQGPQGLPGPSGPRGPQGPSGGGGGQAGVENVASMKAMLPAELVDFDVVSTNGYYEAGDGGEGRYRYLSTATDTPDNGSVIEPDSGIGRFFLITEGRFNTKQFGCKGDGTYRWFRHLAPLPPDPTDDTIQMQAAFDYATDSGDELHISAGIYRITSTLLIRKGWSTTIIGDNTFNYQGYLTFPSVDVPGWKTCMLVLDRLSTNPLLLIRGALNWVGSGVVGPIDPEITSYTSGSAYRNCGTRLENMIFAAQGGSVLTQPLVTFKRLGRCFFTRVVFQNAPYQGLDVISADDSLFDKCYFYVCGDVGKTYALRLRRSVNPPGEAPLLFTNTLSLRDCDFEGNFYGNAQTSGPELINGLADGNSITSLTFTNCIGKSVTVLDSGRNCFDFYNVNTMYLEITAAMGVLAGTNVTADEVVRLRNCSGTTFDIRFGLTAGTRLQVTRFMTIEDTFGVMGRASFLIPVGANLPTDEYMVRAQVGTLGIQPKQIHVSGVIYAFSTGDSGKKVCSTIGVPQNSTSDTLLGELIGANFNSTADQEISIRSPIQSPTNTPFYEITEILVCNASVNMATAAGGIYTGAGKTGTIVVAAAQSYAALTADIKKVQLTIADNDIRKSNPLYFSLTTAQGVAATADIRIYGRPLAS